MDENPQVLYATLPQRIKASIMDSIVFLSLFILCPLVIGTLTGKQTGLNALAMFAPPLLLEPFLISYLGCTLGQYVFGMRVFRIDTNSNCPLIPSFARYYTKLLLGSFSMVYMLFSKKHQAIHDHLAKTIVIISDKKLWRNPEVAKYGEIEQALEEGYTYPSPIRRFCFFILWFIVVFIAVALMIEGTALLMVPGYTLDTDIPKQMDIPIRIIYTISFFALAILASKGYLPGAKRIKNEPEDKNNKMHETNEA